MQSGAVGGLKKEKFPAPAGAILNGLQSGCAARMMLHRGNRLAVENYTSAGGLLKLGFS